MVHMAPLVAARAWGLANQMLQLSLHFRGLRVPEDMPLVET